MTGLIGFNTVDLGNALAYHSRIRGYYNQYGDEFWPHHLPG